MTYQTDSVFLPNQEGDVGEQIVTGKVHAEILDGDHDGL
jgi:hypothetical protein